MSTELALAMVTALWVGILTAISPCPLATNIAAISFIGRKFTNRHYALLTGLLYALGRSLVYVALAVMLVSSLLSAPSVSRFLQHTMDKLLGPILILVGMVLLDLIRFGGSGSGLGEKVGRKVESWGVWAGFALGVVFALSFCPVSAALYFGSLIPLSVRMDSTVLLPLLFGAGTALPVLLFAFLLVFTAQAVGGAYSGIRRFEIWARRGTGLIFVAIGVGFCLVFVFRVF